MTENAKKFSEALKGDKVLQEKLAAALKKISEEGSAKNDADALVKAAKEIGFEISDLDIDKAKAAIQELDPKEMETAAGGWCAWDFSCITVRCDSKLVEAWEDPNFSDFCDMVDTIMDWMDNF